MMEESIYAEGGFPHEEKVRMLSVRKRARPRGISAETLRALIARELGELTEQESLELAERLTNELIAAGRYES